MSKKLTPLRAIRAKCLDCVCFQPSEVRLCASSACPLYPYRDGHNKKRQGMGGVFHPKNSRETAEGTTERV